MWVVQLNRLASWRRASVLAAALVERGDEVGHRWASVRGGGQREIAQPTVAPDHGVGAELMDVLGGLAQAPPAPHQSDVHPQRAERPDLTAAAALGAEQSVHLAVDVGDDGERNVEMLAVGRESPRRGEGDDDDVGVTEMADVFAHGEHVFLARQSSQVAVQHQYQWTLTLFGGAPRLPGVVDEFHVGQSVADAKGHGGDHGMPPV